MSSYGERLKDLRVKAGFSSVEAAAKAVGLDKMTLHAFETGADRQMQARTRAKFNRLAVLYGVPPADVLPDAEPSGTYSVTGRPTDLFISHAHGDTPEYVHRVFDELMTETTSLIHLVGPRGMVLIWRLVDILHTHREHRDTIIPAIDAVLTDLDRKHRSP